MKRRGLTLSFLAFVVLSITLAGCGGVRPIPIGEKVRNADRRFDAAEAFRVTADKDTDQEKRREQVQQKKALYDDALNAYRAIVETEPNGKFAQRSLWQISEIYKRRYKWDKVVENHNAIMAIAPSSYYGDRAKSDIADMSKYRGLIEANRRKYKDYRALYAQNNARENYDIAAQALYDLAESYVRLGDYPEAITHYQRMVDEFPEHEKAPAALTRIGYIHFYRFYDYVGGWPAYNKVTELYPDTYDAMQAHRLLKETSRGLEEIAQNRAEIRRYRSKPAIDYIPTDCSVIPNKKYDIRYVDIVVHCYQFIGRRWKDLRNYPSAIVVYRTLADELPHRKFPAADARYQIGRLYQLNGQLDLAIDAYQELFDNHPESTWCVNGIYQQAVCYRETREFTKAYEGFKAYMGLGRDVQFCREAGQIVRELEMNYGFNVQQETGTSYQDSNGHRGVKSFLIRVFQGKAAN